MATNTTEVANIAELIMNQKKLSRNIPARARLAASSCVFIVAARSGRSAGRFLLGVTKAAKFRSVLQFRVPAGTEVWRIRFQKRNSIFLAKLIFWTVVR
jgi:hypothetical protein